MTSGTMALVASIALVLGAQAQSTTISLGANCVAGSGITALNRCNFFLSESSRCNATTVTLADYRACYCTQNLFSSIFDCESETRLCYANANSDSQFEDLASQWHSICDKAAVPVTTPPVSSLVGTRSADIRTCITYDSACKSASTAAARCAATTTSVSACFCAPPLQTLQYSCGYLFPSCVDGTAPPLSALPAYSLCSDFSSVLGGLMGNATTATANSMTSISTAMGTATTPAMTSLSGASPAPTASVTINRPSSTRSTAAASATTSSVASSLWREFSGLLCPALAVLAGLMSVAW